MKALNKFRLRKNHTKKEQQKAKKYNDDESKGIGEDWKEEDEYNQEY